jgi:hypothetical protein
MLLRFSRYELLLQEAENSPGIVEEAERQPLEAAAKQRQ